MEELSNWGDLYKNPFSEFNANVMDSESILDYWCSPFRYMKFGFKEEELFQDKNTTIFMGGRGSGKTMLFKYSSYFTQWKKAEKSNLSVLQYFKAQGGAGHYIRIDGPLLRSFAGFGIEDEVWNAIFTHYFELSVAKSYIDFLIQLESTNEISEKSISTKFITKLSFLLTGEKKTLTCLTECQEQIEIYLDEVTHYRGMVPISPVKFETKRIFVSQKLSNGIPILANECIEEFEKNFRFVLFIDEFENYLEGQQQVINTLLRFNKQEIGFRIGMRLEGYKTYATINPEEFIKEGRDYKKVVFEEYLIKNKGYQDYLLAIAEKRLSSVPILKEKGFTDIKSILGANENLEKEAFSIVGEKDHSRIFTYFKIKDKPAQKSLKAKNSLLTVLNCIWYNRGEKVEFINQSMTDYLNEVKNEPSIKYHNDYVNKYKYSLTIILCSIYRDKKSYYSFNTLAFLSSGIVGHFIETCRRIFLLVEFEKLSDLLENGTIHPEIQTKAARDHAESELQQVRRIDKYGTKLYHLVQNLGNIFSAYHKDSKVRYPETNQFYLEIGSLEPEEEKALVAAQKWSLIQRKPKLQKAAPGKGKSDLFTLNRVFSPLFEITYRTRGGINEDFSSAEFRTMLVELDTVKPKKLIAKKVMPQKKNTSQGKIEFGNE